MKKVLFIAALFCMVSLASAQIGFNGVGAHIGYVSPEDVDGTIGFGAQADLGTLMPQLGLFAYVDYWGKSYTVYGADASYSVIDIAAIVKYYFSEAKMKPFAGGGLGLDMASAKVKTEYLGEVSDSKTSLAVHLLGGVATQLSPNLDGFAELKYTLADGNYLTIQAGATYKLK
jgi:hypothetical protein